jgi:hypothetical protein
MQMRRLPYEPGRNPAARIARVDDWHTTLALAEAAQGVKQETMKRISQMFLRKFSAAPFGSMCGFSPM